MLRTVKSLRMAIYVFLSAVMAKAKDVAVGVVVCRISNVRAVIGDKMIDDGILLKMAVRQEVLLY